MAVGSRLVTVSEAADALGLPVSGVEALVDAGYLHPHEGRRVALSELKSFQARNAAGGGETAADVFADISVADSGAEEILDAVENSVAEMARRAADVVSGVFPEAAEWSETQRSRFEHQTRRRFEAIVALTRAEGTDDELLSDLADAGGAAAFAGAPLPQVLLTLRISRDLLVQSAVSAAEELGREWGLALAVVLTRVLPVLDRLSDTVARGWWSAVMTREQEAFSRYEHVVEHSANGVYEVDLDGAVIYANPMMAHICGHEPSTLVGRDLVEVLPPTDASAGLDVFRTPTVAGWRPLRVLRADGVARDVLLQVTARTDEGRTVGFDGIIRDVTAERALERQKEEFLVLITQELRQPLTTILGLGVTLELHADELPRDRMANMGRSIHLQSERIARLADDLHDVSRVRADRLTVALRTVSLRATCEAALRMLHDATGVELDVPDDLAVTADGRRLEQVVAHLVENGLRHGAPPVRVTASATGQTACLEVTDAGDGVPPAELDGLFAALRPSAAHDRLRDRVSGLGLPLARSLVEAMGGRIRYHPAESGARFLVHLPLA